MEKHSWKLGDGWLAKEVLSASMVCLRIVNRGADRLSDIGILIS